jgi:hypothetical protein
MTGSTDYRDEYNIRVGQALQPAAGPQAAKRGLARISPPLRSFVPAPSFALEEILPRAVCDALHYSTALGFGAVAIGMKAPA